MVRFKWPKLNVGGGGGSGGVEYVVGERFELREEIDREREKEREREGLGGKDRDRQGGRHSGGASSLPPLSPPLDRCRYTLYIYTQMYIYVHICMWMYTYMYVYIYIPLYMKLFPTSSPSFKVPKVQILGFKNNV